jgi:hypothetical protein
MAARGDIVSNLRGRLSGRGPQYKSVPDRDDEDNQNFGSQGTGPLGERRRAAFVPAIGLALIFVLLISVVTYR